METEEKKRYYPATYRIFKIKKKKHSVYNFLVARRKYVPEAKKYLTISIASEYPFYWLDNRKHIYRRIKSIEEIEMQAYQIKDN